MRLKQVCPCCKQNITFKQLFNAWNKASKDSQNMVRCPHCGKKIQNISTYEKQAFFWALPLFGIPLIYENNYLGYIVGLFSVVYMFFIFFALYLKVPLVCIDSNNDLPIGDKDGNSNSKIKYYLLGIIIIIFFISIASMFYEFAIEMQKKG